MKCESPNMKRIGLLVNLRLLRQGRGCNTSYSITPCQCITYNTNALWASLYLTQANNSIKGVGAAEKLRKRVYIVYRCLFCISKKKKCEKVCTKKNRLIFLSAAGFELTNTAKFKLHRLVPHTSRPRHRVVNMAIILGYILDMII